MPRLAHALKADETLAMLAVMVVVVTLMLVVVTVVVDGSRGFDLDRAYAALRFYIIVLCYQE